MTVSSYSNSEITLKGTPDEIDMVHRLLSGAVWVSRNEYGSLEQRQRYEAIEPKPDPDLCLHYPGSAEAFQAQAQLPLDVAHTLRVSPRNGPVDIDAKMEHASVYLHGIAGYGVAALDLADRYRWLTQVGFVCLRSPRDNWGLYTEVWFLHGSYAAKSVLRGASLKAIVEWVMREIMPGAIDLVVQRYGLSVD